MDTVLVTEQLTKYYGNEKVVNNVNMKILPGEIYGLVGKNGAGKTTIMKMVLSMVNTSKGMIKLFDSHSKNNINQHFRIGAMIENPAFYPYFTAKQNLEYYKIVKGLPKEVDVNEVISMVGLSDARDKKFKKFSLGMKQRLGLALALLGNPDLLILDEPINGLDPEGIKEIRDILIKQNKELGTTIFISSHILSELSQLATKYGFIDKGELIEEITAEQLEEKCTHYIEVKVSDAKRTSKVLEEKLKCTTYEIVDDRQIKIFNFNKNSNQINRILLENDIDVYSLEMNGISLEEYFLELIGRE
ncbi:ATP-binding cassette domain-containing protein [Clostridium cellulovorans]|uniref:ABC transporter related n=1 Tax=Clostridium cellulovorans (strain ATCC 35296 / DSM 3052 / OCM 3 / 743B) TaxID=573061 RepID=D9SN90_CLOC7|nr:ATP-binding cassette domain-containing protein [Clostridium cellulovorans]ADL53882.1 ABC transporter related [Clostridium cellulovorans 743B]